MVSRDHRGFQIHLSFDEVGLKKIPWCGVLFLAELWWRFPIFASTAVPVHPLTNNMTKSPPVTKRELGADTISLHHLLPSFSLAHITITTTSRGRKYRTVCTGILVPLLVVTSPHSSTFALGSSWWPGYPIRCSGLFVSATGQLCASAVHGFVTRFYRRYIGKPVMYLFSVSGGFLCFLMLSWQ